MSNNKSYQNQIKSELDNVNGERFVEAFMLIKSREQMKLFLTDFFTEKEILQLTNRFEAVYWLSLGTPYSQIQRITGLSPAVIARMSKKFIDKRGSFWSIMRDMYPKGAAHIAGLEYPNRLR